MLKFRASNPSIVQVQLKKKSLTFCLVSNQLFWLYYRLGNNNLISLLFKINRYGLIKRNYRIHNGKIKQENRRARGRLLESR